MEAVAIPDAARRYGDYPHQFSGGQRQRILIAMALINRPRLLIADEPTTALDVTVQAQVLELLRGLQQQYGLAMLFISHDLAVVGEVASRVAVMRAGRLWRRDLAQLLTAPQHAYTRSLLAAVPTCEPTGAGRWQWWPLRRISPMHQRGYTLRTQSNTLGPRESKRIGRMQTMTQRASITTAKFVSILAAVLLGILPACSAQTATHKERGLPQTPEPTAPELFEYIRGALLSLSPQDGINDNVDVTYDVARGDSDR